MKIRNGGLLICTLLALVTAVTAQNQYEEFLLENQSDNETVTSKLETLEQLREHPININQASQEELLQIPFLNQQQAVAIIELRTRLGRIHDLNRLSHIENFPPDLILAMQPYVTTDDPEISPRFTLYSRTRVKEKRPLAAGYIKDKYVGNPLKFYQRINFSFYDNWKAGFVVEKDAGESKWNDHAVGFLEYATEYNRLVFGNFYVQTGLGLLFGGLNVSSLSSDPQSPLSRGTIRLRGYQSSLETDLNQGLAWEWKHTKISTILFYSRAKKDASLNENQEVETLPNTGIHRTKTEIDNQNQLTETRVGCSGQYKFSTTSAVNVNFVHTHRDRPFAPLDLTRNRFSLQSQTNQIASVFFQQQTNSLSISAEFATENNYSTAGIVQLTLSQSQFSVFTALWYYAPDFHNTLGRAFGQFSDAPQNSRGYYAGFKFNLSKQLRMTGYSYFERPLWRTYFVRLPRYQQKSLLHLYHHVSPRVQWYAHWRMNTNENEEVQLLNSPPESVLNGDIQKQNIRVQISYGNEAHFLLRDRIEYTWISEKHDFGNTAPKTGWLFFHDFYYRPVPEVSAMARLCYFDTSGYETRVYAYENDVPGVLTNKMLYGRGSHFFLLAKYRLFKRGNIAIKFASTYYDDREVIGSGNERIDANHISEWTVFFDWRW